MRANDFGFDDTVSCDIVAECVGTRRSVVVRLARLGLIETVESETDEPMMPRSAVDELRRMQRLRRDLGVNFAGAAIILDLVGRIEQLKQQLAALDRLTE